MAYIANVTDEQQTDIEKANDDSAIRFFWFDGKLGSTGEVKSIKSASKESASTTDGNSNQDSMVLPGNAIGSHNDKYYKFDF